MMPADRLVHAALERLAPTSLLVLGESEPDGVRAYRRERATCGVTMLQDLPGAEDPGGVLQQRYAAAVVTGIERLPDERARAVIAVLRDRLCDAIVVVVPEEHWGATDWLALGFEPYDRCGQDDRTLVLYQYDVASFNPEREWNNPKDWAHPENFRRYRW